MAENNRVQVRGLERNVRLQPASIASDTYVQPQRPAQNNNLANLSNALASFSGSLGRLGGAVAQPPSQEDKSGA